MSHISNRFGTRDLVITGVVSALGVAAMVLSTNASETPDARWWMAPLFLLCTVPLLWRRVAPLAAGAGALAGLAVHVGLAQDAVVRCGIMLPISFAVAYAAGAYLRDPASYIGMALAVAVGVLVCFSDNHTGADPGALWFVVPLTLGVWVTGRIVRSRGRLAERLRTSTTALEDARQERARLEVAQDRSRLSAELDGMLQQRLAALAALADAGDAGDPDAARATLARIEHESRDTLERMRAMVGSLREHDSDAGGSPAVAHLEALVASAKGMNARLRVEGNPRALPPGVELTAYRVVEHLLDAVQDTPGVEVAVRFADDALQMRVIGPLRRRGGAAIERARERARMDNGHLEATTEAGRTRAEVSLPILAAV
ncbi:MAG: histidine kinase [Thermoleophilia bacterium]